MFPVQLVWTYSRHGAIKDKDGLYKKNDGHATEDISIVLYLF